MLLLLASSGSASYIPNAIRGEHSIFQYPASAFVVKVMEGEIESPEMTLTGECLRRMCSINRVGQVGKRLGLEFANGCCGREEVGEQERSGF